MGLFGGKKTFVSSVLYNMAGDVLERPSFLKTTVMGNIILPSGQSMGSNVTDSYIKGPGVRIRNYFRWALDNYDLIGVPQGSIGGVAELDQALILDQLTADPGKTLVLQYAQSGPADYSYWAEGWMFENHPELINSEWVSEINEATGDIEITFEDTTTASFTPVGFNPNGVYIYAIYSQAEFDAVGDTEVGPTVELGSEAEFSSTAGWTLISSDTDIFGTTETKVYEKTVYMGQDSDPETDIIYSEVRTMTQVRHYDLLGDPTGWDEQITIEKVIHQNFSTPSMFIYEVGTGNAELDALIYDSVNDGEYVPFIPIRIDNQFISESYYPDVYETARKAYRRVTNGEKFSKLIDKIADNESLGDIDYAYIMYGVSLNVYDNAGREYIYRFFDKLRGQQLSENLEYLTWRTQQDSYESDLADYTAWKEAQSDPLDPLYGTMSPGMPTVGSVRPNNSCRIVSNGTSSLNMNINMAITWDTIERSSGSGLAKPGAKKGDYWIDRGSLNTTIISNVQLGQGSSFAGSSSNIQNTITVYHQIDEDEWEALTVVGAKHTNTIYNNKSVVTEAGEAIDDADESSFFIPMHFATYEEMSMINRTQLATISGYIVFNCYKVVKLKWYQTGIFKIVVFIVIVAITIVFPPAGGATGILGSSLAVGLSLGLAGTLALIVGAIANALVAMIIAKLIMAVSVEIFGEKWGAIIGSVASAFALTAGVGLANGQSMSSIWSSMGSASNIMSITYSVGNGIAGYIQAGVKEIAQDTENLLKDYNKESRELTEKYINEFGINEIGLNPSAIMEASSIIYETSDGFLSRTLMTGSDIAEMTLDMVTNFMDYTLSTELK